MKKLILILLICIFAFNVYSLENTQQSNKIFLSPFYRISMDPNTDYNYTLLVNPSDGITEVKSAIVTFQMWINPTVEFFLKVDNNTCNTVSFEVHTTYASAGEGTIFFDCSDEITGAGNYTITLTPDDDTGAITGWIDLTYINNQSDYIGSVGTVDTVDNVASVDSVTSVDSVKNLEQPEISVFGTEYLEGQGAKVWLHLINGSKTGYIENAICLLHIYTPENGVLLEKTTMDYFEDGVYYYDLIAPSQQGVYPAIAECFFDAIQAFTYTNSSTVFVGSDFSGSVDDVHIEDSIEHIVKETTAGNPKRLAVGYNYTNICGQNTSEQFLTSLTVHWIGTWASATNDDAIIHIYNYSSGKYIPLFNKIFSGPDPQHISNTVQLNNLTTAGVTNSNWQAAIYINDTAIVDGSASQFQTDKLYLTCDELTSPEWQEVRGGSEMHISSDIEYVVSTDIETLVSTAYSGVGYEDSLVINFTAFARVYEEEDVVIRYPLPIDTHCDDVEYVDYFNETSGGTEHWVHTDDYDVWHCDIEDGDSSMSDLIIPLTVNEGSAHAFSVKTKNVLKREADKYINNVNYFYDIVDLNCQTYLSDNGFGSKPSLPLTTMPALGDSFGNGCYHFWNEHYYFNQTAPEIDYLISGLETNFDLHKIEEHFKKLKVNYNLLVTDFLIMSTGLEYSALYMDYVNTGDIDSSKYWANKSVFYNLPNSTWNYDVRILTGEQQLWVGGTEYSPDETDGKVVVRLVDGTDTPVNNADCILRVAYPNNTLAFNVTMPLLNGTQMGGVYIADFTLPDEPGVYPYGVDCAIITGPSPKDYFLLDTFHIFGANQTKQAETFWNYDNRTLSTFNFPTTVDGELISNYIWNNTNRTLTAFGFSINATAIINATEIAEEVWSWSGLIADNILVQIGTAIWEYIGARAEII